MTTAATIGRYIAADVPLLFWGAPGGGKTSFLRSWAQAHAHDLTVLSAEASQDADLVGVRVPADGRAALLAPDWAISVEAGLKAGRRQLVFIDELTCFPRSAEAALLGFVADRRFAGLDLRGCRVVAAANPPELAADGRELSPAAASRFAHRRWMVDPRAWAAAARGGWTVPLVAGSVTEPDAPTIAAARSILASYVEATSRPGEAWWDCPPLHCLPRDPVRLAEGRWPCPRTWDMAARLVSACAGRPGACWSVWRDDPEGVVASCVGDDAAGAISEWVGKRELPDPEAVLADPEAHPLPERIDALLACVQATCAAAVAAHPQIAARWAAAWTLLGRLPRDVAVVGAGVLARARRDDPALRALDVPQMAVGLAEAWKGVA